MLAVTPSVRSAAVALDVEDTHERAYGLHSQDHAKLDRYRVKLMIAARTATAQLIEVGPAAVVGRKEL
jgi:hypothetical protein